MNPSPSLRRRAPAIFYFLAALLGFALFALGFGFLLLNPKWVGWMYVSSREQYDSAWLAYRHAPWSFPLGRLPNFFFPHGSSIAFMDGVPLYLTFLKLFNSVLPDPFAAWGWWMVICCILQSVTARMFMEQLTEKEPVRWIGTLFLSFSPVLIQRNDHFALLAQWLILLSWSNFFRKDQGSKKTRWLWAITLLLTAGIHPYLTAMVIAIRFGALLFSNAAMKSKAVDFIVSIFIVGAIFLLFGYFQNGTTGDEGADVFSADLATFIMPFDSSSLWPPTPTRPGEQEGYAYLGLGAMLLTFIAVALGAIKAVRSRKEFRENKLSFIYNRTFQAFLIAGVMLLYSFGPYLRLFGAGLASTNHFHNPLYFFFQGKLSEIPLILRAPGRFTWPFYYLLIAWSVTAASSRIVILLLALLLQVADFGPELIHRHKRFYTGAKPPALTHADNVRRIRSATEIMFIPMEPRMMCGFHKLDEALMVLKAVLPLAAERDIPLNSGLQARLPATALAPLCLEQIEAFKAEKFKKGAVYIVDNQYMKPELTAPDSPLDCRVFESLSVCVATRDNG